MDVVLKASGAESLPELGRTLRVELADGPASVRQLSARMPGVASEPLTTAILVAIAGHVAAGVAEQLFTAVSQWVKKHRTPVTIEVPAAAPETSNATIVIIVPDDADSEATRQRVMDALGVAQGQR